MKPNYVMRIRISGQEYDPPAGNAAETDHLFLGWNQHCFTWKANGMFKVCVHHSNKTFIGQN